MAVQHDERRLEQASTASQVIVVAIADYGQEPERVGFGDRSVVRCASRKQDGLSVALFVTLPLSPLRTRVVTRETHGGPPERGTEQRLESVGSGRAASSGTDSD